MVTPGLRLTVPEILSSKICPDSREARDPATPRLLSRQLSRPACREPRFIASRPWPRKLRLIRELDVKKDVAKPPRNLRLSREKSSKAEHYGRHYHRYSVFCSYECLRPSSEF